MKRLLFFVCIAFTVTSCNNSAKKSEAKAEENISTAKYDYPYTLTEAYREWQPGDQQHAVTAMKALKAFENGDIAATVANFADSVEVRFDYFQAKMSNDSLKKFFANQRANYNSLSIKMSDWESVISKDKKTEYVTMWYRQIWTDKNGKTDSISVVDDCKIVNGKIAELDEKIQRFQAKK